MSLRLKIVIGFIVIIITSYIILAFATSTYVNNLYVKEVQTRVRLDLNSAHGIYFRYQERIDNILQAVAIRRSMDQPLHEEVKEELGNVLNNIYHQSGIDILILIDVDGNVVYRAHNPGVKGDNLSEISIIKKLMQEWKPVNGTIVLNEQILEKEGIDLLKRAAVKVKSTPRSRPEQKLTEKRGMFIAAAVPISSLYTNKKLGILFAGYLINNNNEIVDEIKSKIFQDQTYKGKDIGTATIFFDDLRIATNVKQQDNTRAIGSRLSIEVYNHVISEGKIWADRAFVVNDWYLTAYEPIINPEGKIIGSLYVGLLEDPFKYPSRIIIIFFIIALSITSLASLILIFFYTKMMMRPIDHIVKMCRKIISGDLSARCNVNPSGEMGILCRTINQMAESIEQHEKKILDSAQKQIIQSEKLASIGRLAAGIAHEINNPLTGVLTFAHFLKENRANDEKDIEDIDVIIKETTRVRDIIRGLLNFARQSPSNKELTNINEIIQVLLILIKGQKEFRNVQIIEHYEKKLPELLADKNQLQQVFLNLVLNAGESINGKGIITIETSATCQAIKVAISDSGGGIKDEDMDKIFDPFFTTKPVGQGTGLGLSVSYGIIEQHGGVIQCESKVGEGTTFNILLPLKQL